MKNEEQIDDACTNWICSQEDGTVIMARNVWRAAVEWADSHPQWIPVEEKLPKHNVEDNGLITYKEVLVCLNDGYVTTDCYDDTRKKWLGYNGDVEYWMPTPQPPRKE